METYEDSILLKKVILEYYGLVQNSISTVSKFILKIFYKGTTNADIIYDNTSSTNSVDINGNKANFVTLSAAITDPL